MSRAMMPGAIEYFFQPTILMADGIDAVNIIEADIFTLPARRLFFCFYHMQSRTAIPKAHVMLDYRDFVASERLLIII